MSAEDDSSGWQLTESDPGVFTYVPCNTLAPRNFDKSKIPENFSKLWVLT